MRDALLDLGSISSFSASEATTETRTTLDLGYDNYFGSDVPAKVVFTATKAVTGFTPMLLSSADGSSFSVYAKGAKVASLAVGDTVELNVPIKLLRYIEAAGSATATAGAVTAHIELGGTEK